jgi:hypothetical protein
VGAMSGDLSPRQAVYALARTQLDWIPDPPTAAPNVPAGFAAGRNQQGQPLRWLACPDCLTNGFTSTDCETCGGRGEIPDPSQRDPYEVTNTSPFYGDEHHARRQRARIIDGQIVRLQQLARARDGDPAALPEDWLSRALRLKALLHGRGDYALLEQAQDLLAARLPGRHLAWAVFVVDREPLRAASAVAARLDESADWLAGVMLSAIASRVAWELAQQDALGAARRRTRPVNIVVPVELVQELADEQAGKGRWANGHGQGQRNATLVGMAADGKTAGEIARRVGLTKRRVQQLLAESGLQSQATGPAA